MMNTIQSSTDNPNRGATHHLYRLYLFALVVVVLLAETISIIVIFKRHELHLDSLGVYVFPLLVLLPGLTGIRTYYQFKVEFASIAPTKSVPPGSARAFDISHIGLWCLTYSARTPQ